MTGIVLLCRHPADTNKLESEKKKLASISYYLKRISKMDYKSMFEKVKEVSKKSGKSKIHIFFDMIWCGFRYGARIYGL